MKYTTLSIVATVLIFGILTAAQTPALPAQQQTAQTAAAAAPKSGIEGTVVRSGSGQPLKGVQITVQRTDTTAAAGRGGRGAQPNAAAGLGALGDLLGTIVASATGASTSVSTDASGHFAVTGLAAGQYRITADREGLIRQEFGRRTTSGRGTSVSIAAGQTFSANFQMDPAAVITGKVRDNSGEPVFRATVQAYTYRYSNGDRSLNQVATTQTDDLGQYRLFPITPGDYFLSVTSRSESTAASRADASAPAARGGGLGNIQSLLGNIGGGQQNALADALSSPGGAAPFFYPGTSDPDAAAPIHVTSSAEIRGIDLNLRPIPTVTVSGHVAAPFALGQQTPAAAGRGGNANAAAGILGLLGGAGGGQNAQVSISRIGSARAGLASLLGGLSQIRIGADGAFQIPNVAPGPYYLNASASDNGQRYTGRVRIDVGTTDITNATIEVRSGIEVQGRITVDNPPANFKLSQLRVNLVEAGNAGGNLASTIGNLLQGGGGARAAGGRGGNGAAAAGGGAAAAGRGGAAAGGTGGAAGGTAAAGNRGGANAAPPQVSDDGMFTLQNVNTAIEYRVTISNASGSYLVDGHMGGTDVLSAPFTVEQGANLQLRIGFTTGRVTGTVVEAGKPFAGAQVVLVPDAPRRSRNDMFFTSTSDANGAFNFANVPVGTYRMFAWEDVPTGAYQYPEFLKPYESQGIPVRVEQGTSGGGELKLIPATTD